MKAFTALIALASAVNAHMIMRNPVPAGSPNNSPLAADGSDFPCKTGGGQIDTSKPNVMTIGSSNNLDFTGSATHGGGSCQVSLAKGTTVDKNTKWMVIHSIEGGCPAPNNNNQNIGDDPSGTGASTFQFTIPNHPDIAAGDYTLAWTWHNRIGNREMYMNCAYVKLGGAAKKRYAPSRPAVSRRDQAPLPDIFVANIGNGCSTTEGTDVKYPAPGQSVETGPGANLAPPVGNCGAAGAAPSNPTTDGSASPTSSAAAGGSAISNTNAPGSSATGGFGGNPSGGSPSNGQSTRTGGGVFATVGGPSAAASAVVTASSVAGGSPVASASAGNGQFTQSAPGVFASGAASQSAPAVSAPAASAASSVAPVVTPPSAPSASASIAPAAPSGTSAPTTPITSGQTTAGTKCTSEGAWACASDGKSFQRCASEQWSVSIQMSAGMSCIPGISANFAYNASSGGSAVKRDLKSHIARRRHNNIHSPSFS